MSLTCSSRSSHRNCVVRVLSHTKKLLAKTKRKSIPVDHGSGEMGLCCIKQMNTQEREGLLQSDKKVDIGASIEKPSSRSSVMENEACMEMKDASKDTVSLGLGKMSNSALFPVKQKHSLQESQTGRNPTSSSGDVKRQSSNGVKSLSSASIKSQLSKGSITINLKLPKKTTKKSHRKRIVQRSDSETDTPESPDPSTPNLQKYVDKPSLLNDCDKPSKLIKLAHPFPQKQHFRREKSNSTSTLFMNTKLEAPDVNEVIQCLSVALFWGIRRGSKCKSPKFDDVWSEILHPLGTEAVDLTVVPSIFEIQHFLLTTFSTVDLSAECGVMAIAYVDRILVLSGISLHPSNWRRIVLGALVVASKVWEDQAVWNSDFLRAFPKIKVRDLNDLERAYLTKLQFCLSLKASVYAKYYFELRALSERDEEHFPLLPMDENDQKRLEMRSIGLEKRISAKKPKLRSESADKYRPSPRPVTLKF